MKIWKKLCLTVLFLAISFTFLSTPVNASSSSQKNALKSAKEWISIAGVSKTELKNYLKDEGYTLSDIQYALTHCGANWNKEAVQSAKSFLKYNPYSKSYLKQYLYEIGFTKSQVKYVLKHYKPDWNKIAVRFAKLCIKELPCSKETLENNLIANEFTKSQIKYVFKHYKPNWNKEALQAAKEYKKTDENVTKHEMKVWLKTYGFTSSQIKYAINRIY